jgi:glycosyltransferase involved in cell wall biosynthesis
MTVTLRVVLDQLVGAPASEATAVSAEVARALVATAPRDCDVAALVPSGDTAALAREVPGLARVDAVGMPRSATLTSWQLGVAPGVGGGLIHSPTLAAPLVRHDRINDNDQTVVTLWELPDLTDAASKTAALAHKAMLKRAERHADAVIVPTHAIAERLAATTKLRGRVRVIAGAAPQGFAVPGDAIGRRRALVVPDRVLVLDGSGADADLDAGFAAALCGAPDVPIVVLGAADLRVDRVRARAEQAGVPSAHLRVLAGLDAHDRAAVLEAAVAVVAPSRASAFPWRVVEAFAVGVPVIASDSDDHREIIVDGGVLAEPAELGATLHDALDDTARLRVLARDRGRSFAWLDHAARVWELHAEL